jgi:zinc protease
VGGSQIQQWETPNGVRVLFVEAPDLPMLDLELVFDAGSTRDGDLPGLSTLTSALLDQGAGDWDADQIAERLESVGAQLSAGSSSEMATLSVRSLTEAKPLQVALETLAAVAAKPRLAEADLQRKLEQMRANLREEAQSPGEIVSREFLAALYGNHPYGIHPSGSETSLAQMTTDQVRAFHQRYYVARNALVALVGAIDRAQAERIAEQVTRDLPAGEPAPELPPVADLAAGRELRIPFPSTQSHLRIGQPGMRRGDPDYFVLYVGNHILGGSGLVSILADEVREKRGLSYSVYSYFSPLRREGPFTLGAQTKNAQADQALQVMRETLQRFIDEGPSEQQLQEAKQNITGGFPLRIASNSKIADYLAVIGFYGLPLTYLDEFVGRIEAVTREQVKDAFQRRLHLERMITLVVGGDPGAGG